MTAEATSSPRTADGPVRVLIVDDDPQIRANYHAVLGAQSRDFTIVAEADNGQDAVELYRTHRPDIVLMDLQMPVMNGIEATQTICASWPDACIVALTTFGTHEYIVEALRAGAAGYLLKDAQDTHLLAAMRQALQGDLPMSSTVRRALVASLIDEPSRKPQDMGLSPREQEVLQWLSQGLSNQQIAEKMFISQGSVKQYLNHVSTKLGVKGRTPILIKAVQLGLVDLTNPRT